MTQLCGVETHGCTEEVEEVKPLPCPFCGKDPVVSVHPGDDGMELVLIRCRNHSGCWASVDCSAIQPVGCSATKEAIRRWNIRA